MVVSETADTIPTTDPAGDRGIDTPPTRLLVLGLAHPDGSIVGTELFSVLEPCGLTVDQVRSQMRRLVAEGLFEREGEGRDAVFRATQSGLAALAATSSRHTLAYAHDAAGTGWDRLWRLVMFNIPESRRADRDSFRDWLLSLGAAPLQGGVYVSPHPWDREVRNEIARLDIADFVTLATTDDLVLAGVSNARQIAATLWPLDEIAAKYTDFVASYAHVPGLLESMRRDGRKIAEADWLPGVLLIAVRFNQCFEIDPLLPPELVPKPWPGRDARQLLAACRKLGVMTREDRSGPALFRVFDEAIAALP